MTSFRGSGHTFYAQDQMGTHSVAVRSIPKTFPFIPSTACRMHIHKHSASFPSLRGQPAFWELEGSWRTAPTFWTSPPLPFLCKEAEAVSSSSFPSCTAEKSQEGTRSLPSLGIFPVIQHESMKTQRSAQGLQPKADQCQKISNPTHWWNFKKTG